MTSPRDGPGRRFADSLDVGTAFALGAHRVTEAEIIEFATRWDPQDFHIDPAAARDGHFGEVIASGVHTLAIFQRLAVEAVYRHWAVIGGRRISRIEFLSPVRAEMTLTGDLLITSIEPESPSRSLITAVGTLSAAHEPVFTIDLQIYLARH
jgi:acyl dehydratase